VRPVNTTRAFRRAVKCAKLIAMIAGTNSATRRSWRPVAVGVVPQRSSRLESRALRVGALCLSLLATTACADAPEEPILTVKDVAYNNVDAGDGDARVAIYFSDHTGLCDAESREERRPGEHVAIVFLEGVSATHVLLAGAYLVGQTDPRVVATFNSYDQNCALVPSGDGAGSGSVKVSAATANDSPLMFTSALTFADHGQSLNGTFSAPFCPSIVDRSGDGYHCPN
jgi:hypothetical protein